MSYPTEKLKDISIIKTGKLDSNAAVVGGQYPFFTCDPTTLQIDKWAYDTEAVLLAGNNASGNYTAKYYKGKFNAYQRTYIIEIADHERLNVRFLCYAMNQQLRLLKTMSAGTSTKFLTIKILNGLDIPVPDIGIQNKISEIVGTYDDLIENNKKQIKLLEEAAQRLYKEWFIDLHIPGYKNTQIIDGLPTGWKKNSLDKIGCRLESGSRPKGGIDSSIKDGVPSIGAENVIGLGEYNFSSEKLISHEFYRMQKRGKLQDRDILIYKDGAYIGRTSLFQDGFPYYTASVNEHVFLLHMQDEALQYYVFLTLYQKEYFDKMQKLNTNAAQPGINSKSMLSLQLIIPTTDLIKPFNSFVTPIIQSIFAKAKQNKELQQARDRLLPKLMSGEIEV